MNRGAVRGSYSNMLTIAGASNNAMLIHLGLANHSFKYGSILINRKTEARRR